MGRRMPGVAVLAVITALLAVAGSVVLGVGPFAAGSASADQATFTADPPTTIAPLGTSVPVSAATLPLRTSGGDAHVSPVFAILSGIGFAVALLIVATRMFVTRRGGPDRRPYPVEPQSDGTAAAPDQSPASRSS